MGDKPNIIIFTERVRVVCMSFLKTMCVYIHGERKTRVYLNVFKFSKPYRKLDQKLILIHTYPHILRQPYSQIPLHYTSFKEIRIYISQNLRSKFFLFHHFTFYFYEVYYIHKLRVIVKKFR